MWARLSAVTTGRIGVTGGIGRIFTESSCAGTERVPYPLNSLSPIDLTVVIPISQSFSIFYSYCTNKAKLTSPYCLPHLHLLLENSLISVNETKMTEQDKDPEHSESKNGKREGGREG